MLVDARFMETPELDASFDVCDLRTPHLRVARMRSRNVITDWGLVDRAMPFVHRMGRRSNLTIVVEGSARFEERGRRAYMDVGDLVFSRSDALGTEAYSGDRSIAVAIEWDPAVFGAAANDAFSVHRLDERARRRLSIAVERLDGPSRARAVVDILDILRANGFALAPVAAGDLADPVATDLQRLQYALSTTLAALQTMPTIEDVASALGWDFRRVHRRMSALRESHRHTWAHWRDLAHRARITQALRLLSARGATTERVARLAGFRSPTGLCHAFAEVGLPSPGELARAARVQGLERWGELVR